MVTPVEMAAIIADKYTRKELDVQFLELDEKNNIYFKDLYETPKNMYGYQGRDAHCIRSDRCCGKYQVHCPASEG
jgi:hypothetical protein